MPSLGSSVVAGNEPFDLEACRQMLKLRCGASWPQHLYAAGYSLHHFRTDPLFSAPYRPGYSADRSLGDSWHRTRLSTVLPIPGPTLQMGFSELLDPEELAAFWGLPGDGGWVLRGVWKLPLLRRILKASLSFRVIKTPNKEAEGLEKWNPGRTDEILMLLRIQLTHFQLRSWDAAICITMYGHRDKVYFPTL